MIPSGGTSPAELLEGRTLDGGWKVVKRIDPGPGGTGGNFSVGYLVERSDGLRGFCKALDFAAVFRRGGDPATLLQQTTELFNFERNLLHKCDGFRMSRVIRILADGVEHILGALFPVSYIVFEYAEYDIRRELDQEEDLEAALRLRTLHHVATGLRQLHAIEVAHQDLKPSNVLVIDPRPTHRDSKIGDLGRATDSQVSAPHDDADIAGDRTYAPPEQLYGAIPVEWGPRRLACDLYHLGSLTTFMFTGLSMNSLLASELYPPHLWTNWPGTYSEVLLYVRDAFGRAMATFREAVPEEVADRLTAVARCLCEPDPYLRGHPIQRRTNSSNPYGLLRIVTELDHLAIRAAMRVEGKKV
jgi:serine/threonine protein kinase